MDKLNPLRTEKPRTDWPQNDADVWASIPEGDPRRATHEQKMEAVLSNRGGKHVNREQSDEV